MLPDDLVPVALLPAAAAALASAQAWGSHSDAPAGLEPAALLPAMAVVARVGPGDAPESAGGGWTAEVVVVIGNC